MSIITFYLQRVVCELAVPQLYYKTKYNKEFISFDKQIHPNIVGPLAYSKFEYIIDYENNYVLFF